MARLMGTHFRNSRALATIVAALSVSVLLLGDLVRDLHLLGAAHVVCLAHGELVDAPESADGARVGLEPTRSVTLPRGPAAQDHDHCSLGGATTGPSAVGAPGPVLVLLVVSPEAVITSSRRDAVSTTVVVEYAPKQGPPAGA